MRLTLPSWLHASIGIHGSGGMSVSSIRYPLSGCYPIQSPIIRVVNHNNVYRGGCYSNLVNSPLMIWHEVDTIQRLAYEDWVLNLQKVLIFLPNYKFATYLDSSIIKTDHGF